MAHDRGLGGVLNAATYLVRPYLALAFVLGGLALAVHLEVPRAADAAAVTGGVVGGLAILTALYFFVEVIAEVVDPIGKRDAISPLVHAVVLAAVGWVATPPTVVAWVATQISLLQWWSILACGLVAIVALVATNGSIGRVTSVVEDARRRVSAQMAGNWAMLTAPRIRRSEPIASIGYSAAIRVLEAQLERAQRRAASVGAPEQAPANDAAESTEENQLRIATANTGENSDLARDVDVPQDLAPADWKECPMCAEKVRLRARLCRYCRHEFIA